GKIGFFLKKTAENRRTKGSTGGRCPAHQKRNIQIPMIGSEIDGKKADDRSELLDRRKAWNLRTVGPDDLYGPNQPSGRRRTVEWSPGADQIAGVPLRLRYHAGSGKQMAGSVGTEGPDSSV